MKLDKTIGEELFKLFSFNGSNGEVGATEKRRLAALKELERHGIVRLEKRELGGVVLFDVVRLCCGGAR